MRVIIAGSLSIKDQSHVDKAVEESKFNIDTVITGGSKSIDTLAESWAFSNDKNLIVMNADWETYGRAAGYRRNVSMAESADALIAIWDGKSQDTMHMINIARDKGLKTYVKIAI